MTILGFTTLSIAAKIQLQKNLPQLPKKSHTIDLIALKHFKRGITNTGLPFANGVEN